MIEIKVLDRSFESMYLFNFWAIPFSLVGQDMIVQAKSSMGKTAVFVIATLICSKLKPTQRTQPSIPLSSATRENLHTKFTGNSNGFRNTCQISRQKWCTEVSTSTSIRSKITGCGKWEISDYIYWEWLRKIAVTSWSEPLDEFFILSTKKFWNWTTLNDSFSMNVTTSLKTDWTCGYKCKVNFQTIHFIVAKNSYPVCQ